LIAATLLTYGDFGLAWFGTSTIVMLVVFWAMLKGSNPVSDLQLEEKPSPNPVGGGL
jgi:hypothetical protein